MPAILTMQKPINRANYSASGSGGSWQLSAGHWMPAKRSLYLVYPRPDAETNTWAYHRKAYFDSSNPVQYRVRVGVSWGAPPYYYRIIASPAGVGAFSIGQIWGDSGYRYLTWTPTATVSTPQIVTVRVTDQDLNYIDVTWTVSTSSSLSDFIFLAASGGSDSNAGSITAPFASTGKAIASAYAQARCIVRGGSYTNNAGGSLSPSQSPMSIVAFPGETPNFLMSSTSFGPGAGGSADLLVQGITFTGGNSSVSNYRMFDMSTQDGRQSWVGNNWVNPVNGTASDDNPTGVMLWSVSTQRQQIMIADNFESGRPVASGSNSAGMMIAFTTENSLYEGNSVTGSNGGQGNILMKSSARYCCQRFNYIQADTTPQGFALGAIDQVDFGIIPGDNEICYNTISAPTNQSAIASNYRYSQVSTAPQQYWIYRNTCQGSILPRNSTATNGPFTLEQNAIVVANGYTPILNDGGLVSVTNTGTECQGLTTAGILDSSLLLTGSYRAGYLGTRGAEIA